MRLRSVRSSGHKITVRDAEMRAVNLHGDEFHPEWNYSIKPKP